MKSYTSENLKLGRLGAFDRNVTTIKRLGENATRITFISSCRASGIECGNYVKKNSKNTVKLSNNITRARSTVMELILCNDFKYFCTFTVSPDKFDRYNLQSIYKAFSKFIQNYNRYCNDSDKVSYIIIPEHHKDGAWHFHGVLNGIKDSDLVVNENGYLDWISYSKKFGYMSISTIKSKEKVSSYIQKYITKDLSNTVQTLGGHTFYASKGLKRAETIFKGQASLLPDVSWDYEHPDGYCKIKTINENFTPLDSVVSLEYEY